MKTSREQDLSDKYTVSALRFLILGDEQFLYELGCFAAE